MGLMNKFKNMFTEEIEDEPIKKEVIQVEIPAPTKVEKERQQEEDMIDVLVARKEQSRINKEEPKMPVREEKKEEKFTFPVFFDDKDFDTIEKPVKEPKIEKKIEPYSGGNLEVPKEKPRVFKPTPVISPIFGVLDKNYKKEDITNKGETNYMPRQDHTISVDDIRNKAFGTLEDDLESSLLQDDLYVEPAVYQSEKDMFDDFDLLGDVLPKEESDDFMDFKLPAAETRESRNENKDVTLEDVENENVDKKENTDDLFDLIDSMYEKGDKLS